MPPLGLRLLADRPHLEGQRSRWTVRNLGAGDDLDASDELAGGHVHEATVRRSSDRSHWHSTPRVIPASASLAAGRTRSHERHAGRCHSASRNSAVHQHALCGKVIDMSTPTQLDDVLSELGAFVTGEIAATQIAIGCLRTVARQALQMVEDSDDHHSVRLLGAGVPDTGWITTVYGITGARALVDEMRDGGNTHCRLTQQLIVSIFTGWDAHFQARIAAEHGIPKGELRADFFGDLRLLRNDIVHHRGTATHDGSPRCRQSVVHRQLTEGDPIYLTDQDLQLMRSAIPWETLLKGPRG